MSSSKKSPDLRKAVLSRNHFNQMKDLVIHSNNEDDLFCRLGGIDGEKKKEAVSMFAELDASIEKMREYVLIGVTQAVSHEKVYLATMEGIESSRLRFTDTFIDLLDLVQEI